MNQKQPYVPNYEKWIKYYQSIGTSEHPYYHSVRRANGQIGGPIGKTGHNTIIPIEKQPSEKRADKTPELKVEFISPSQQVVDQAASEIERERGIKRKQSVFKKQSAKSARRNKVNSKNDGNQF